MSFPHSLLARIRASSSPSIVWYGESAERIELSGRVLDNWVAKTANLLADELDVQPGDRVMLATGTHWRTLVFALAAWAVGAEVVTSRADQGEPGELPRADVLFTTDPVRYADRAETVLAVALPGLAMTFGGDPGAALDYNTEVRNQPDVFTPLHPDDPAAAALSTVPAGEAAPRTYRQLAEETGDQSPARSRLVAAGTPVADFLIGAIADLGCGETIVATSCTVADELAAIRAAERIAD
ncbi:TIGR03089 family protein [Saxibacter everestensis]|uniref:TIGR03089 family protein n=1 Tax=Saxibacter everestensis TaxID=2909229 RepID=A0ABY8QP39_9MICO|nr:TIGR03089 family protein [Brevibacteriaceae bacterium ZFBP1038]